MIREKFLASILFCWVFPFVLVNSVVFGASTDRRIEELSLEELLNVKIQSASQSETENTIRSAPSIVSVITADEIQKMGVVDLSDLLRTIPGLDLGFDTEGQTGLAVRGNWAFEGKFLLLWDGQRMNELMYGTVGLAHRFPVHRIKRIEIIRGPGSAMFGGSAELAVIHIVTKDGSDYNGMEFQGIYSQMGQNLGFRNFSASFGKQMEDWNVLLSTYIGEGQRSDRNWTDKNGASYNLNRQSNLDPFFSELKLERGGFKANLVVDRYNTTQRDGYGELLPKAVDTSFNSIFAGISYEHELTPDIRLIEEFQYKHQKPYLATDPSLLPDFEDVYFDVLSERWRLAVSAQTKINSWIKNNTGFEWYRDSAHSNYGNLPNQSSTGFSYNNFALFTEFSGKTSVANFTLGSRYEYNSLFYSSFVPRIALTKTVDWFHAKALYSRSFRAPFIQNIVLNPSIRPERASVAEIELGAELSKNQFLTANFFNVFIDSPIIYSVVNGGDNYFNSSQTGTQGLEIEYRYKFDLLDLRANYSYYRSHDNQVAIYSVPGDDQVHLGIPAHKVAFTTNWGLTDQLTLSPTLIWTSSRYGYEYTTGTGILTRYPAQAVGHLHLSYRNFLIERLNLGLGVFNIFNTNYVFVQPYADGEKSPLPGRSREYQIRLQYAVDM